MSAYQTPRDGSPGKGSGAGPARAGRRWGMEGRGRQLWTRVLGWVSLWIVGILFLVAALVLVARHPWTQTRVAAYLADYVYTNTGYQITIDRVSFNLYDHIRAQGITVLDTGGRTMIMLPEADLDVSWPDLLARDVRLRSVVARGGQVYIYIEPTTSTANADDFLQRLSRLVDPDTTPSPNPPTFFLDHAELMDFSVRVHNPSQDTLAGAGVFDYHDFTVDSLTTVIRGLRQRRDTVELRVVSAKGQDRKTGLPIHELRTQFAVTKQSLDFAPLYARVGKSVLADTVRFRFAELSDLSNFNHAVWTTASVRNAVLHYDDLGMFNESLRQKKDVIRISDARYRGRVDSFYLKGADARFGDGSRVVGDLRMVGLPKDPTEVWMGIEMRRGTVLGPLDLLQYLPDISHAYIRRFGRSKLRGTFEGRARDFKLELLLESLIGELNADLELKAEHGRPLSYRGRFEARGLALGQLTDLDGTLGQVTGVGTIEGQGTDLSARVRVRGTFEHLDLYGYPYRNIETNALLARRHIEGMLAINDPNLQARGEGTADLSGRQLVLDAAVKIDTARLGALGYLPPGADPIDLAARGRVQGKAATIDDAEGWASLKQIRLSRAGRSLKLDSLKLETQRDGDERYIALESDLARGRLEGEFLFSDLLSDLQASTRIYGRLLSGNQKRPPATTRRSSSYHLEGRFDLSDLTPALAFADTSLRLEGGASLELTVIGDRTMVAQASLDADRIGYGAMTFDSVSADLTSSMLAGGLGGQVTEFGQAPPQDILASASIFSRRQRLGQMDTRNLALIADWSGGEINLETRIAHEDTNHIRLRGAVAVLSEGIEGHLTSADIVLQDTVWRLSAGNRFTYDGQRLRIDSLRLQSLTQGVELAGWVGPTLADTMALRMGGLTIGFLDAFAPGPFRGRATAQFFGAGLFGESPRIWGDVRVPSMSYKGVTLGNLEARMVPRFIAEGVSCTYRLTDSTGQRRLASGGGDVGFAHGGTLALRAHLEGASVRAIEPFFEGLASDFAGALEGDLELTGTFATPELTGDLFVRDGALTVDYLGTRYFFSDSVRMRPGVIRATGITLRDAFGNRGRLERANIRHRHFDDFSLDVQARLQGLQALSTTPRTNDLYYGTAFASGGLSITGPVGDILIRADLRSERGTRIFLPIEQAMAAETQQSGFITFVDSRHKESADSMAATAVLGAALAHKGSTDSLERRVNLSGIRMVLNLDLTPEATGELILDRRTGDLIRVNGQGALKMVIDSRGEFAMFGRYGIAQGLYKFTFGGLINKDFDILPGSSIVWTGDPTAGQLDINARYESYVPLTPLIIGAPFTSAADSARLSLEASRRYLVNANMRLMGPMLTPAINLGVEIPPSSYPNTLAPYVNAFEGLLATNEQELNKQVFSLLMLRSLTPVQTGVSALSGTGYGVSNLTEMLSSQLSSWLSSVNQNLDVSLNMAGFSQAAVENIQLRLSYSMLGGRLRITRNGAFTNAQAQTTATSVAGDWSIEYMLTRDGQLRAKMFHRTNQALMGQASIGQPIYNTTQGASLMHTTSFNSIRELLPGARRRAAETGRRERQPSLDLTPAPALSPERERLIEQPPTPDRPTVQSDPRDGIQPPSASAPPTGGGSQAVHVTAGHP